MTDRQNKHSASVKLFLDWLEINLPLLLLSLTLVLFISKSLYNVPMAIMALLGAWQVIKNPSVLISDKLIRSYLIVFTCIWLPMVIAFIDAVDHAHSAQTVLPYLRYLFAGIYVLTSKHKERTVGLVFIAIFFVVTFWSIDASVQYFFGKNLFGYPYERGHITGMFYPRNTIAHLLAALSPIYFESIRNYSKKYKWVWFFILPLVVVILLSGRRAAWIMLVLGSTGYMLYLYKLGEIGLKTKKRLLIIGMTIFISSLLVIATNKPLQNRIAATVGIFSFDYEAIDRATAYRLPIWETAISVFQDNWINGIGPRGFRHVYTQYSDMDDIWHLTGTTHPHQLVLEVLAETGVIGIAGLAIFVFLLYVLFRSAPNAGFIVPCALAVFVVLFPINTSMAFYGSYWSSVIWWLMILAYLCIYAVSEQTPPITPSSN